MNRILVIEDEPSLRTDLLDFLSLRGFEAQGAATASEARAILAAGPSPAIVILDIGLPDGDGFDLAEDIRALHDSGILILTSRGSADDRVRGFESGADIYLVKHATLREIEAALNSLSRRLGNSDGRTRSWSLNPATWVLQAPDGRDTRLTATELAFIAALLEHNGEPCPRETLLERLARPNAHWDNPHLDSMVNRLRRKIKTATGQDAPIKSVYGVGYAFGAVGEITE